MAFFPHRNFSDSSGRMARLSEPALFAPTNAARMLLFLLFPKVHVSCTPPYSLVILLPGLLLDMLVVSAPPTRPPTPGPKSPTKSSDLADSLPILSYNTSPTGTLLSGESKRPNLYQRFHSASWRSNDWFLGFIAGFCTFYPFLVLPSPSMLILCRRLARGLGRLYSLYCHHPFSAGGHRTRRSS